MDDSQERPQGSSKDGMEERYRDGLKTPPKTRRGGNLGAIEVEIRRIKSIVGVEELPEEEGNDDVELTMTDAFNDPPWLIVRFDLWNDAPLRKENWGQHLTEGSPAKSLQRCYKLRWTPNGNRDDSGDSDALDTEVERLQEEGEEEEAETRNWLHKLQVDASAM